MIAVVTDGDDPWGQTFDTTAATVVSNTGQAQEASTININGSTVTHSAANVFTTGDDANGYNLRNVELFVNDWGTVPLSGLTASIWSVTSGGAPDSLLFTLTNPASRTNGAVNVFTAPVGAKLERSTAYALVVRNSHTALSRLAVTTSNDEDSGAASGWSIADSHRTSLRDGWTIPQHSSMLFSVTASEYVPHDDAIAVTINVGNVNEPPTAAPADLAVTDQTSRTLSLSWTAVAAAAGGPDPNAYDVRWFEGSTDPAAGNEADWVEPGEEGGHSSPGAGVTTTLGGLEPDTAYRVQVRANSADGPGPWSSSVDGTTNDDPDITLTVSPTSVTEGNSATVTVRASRLVAENSDAVTVQVTAQTASTATSGVDYTAFTVLAITIPADTASAEESLTIATTEDTTHEGDETIVLGATVDGFGVIGATFTIIDDDFPSITIEGGSAVTEGTAATFTLTADQAPVANLTVNLTVSDVTGSDFVAAGNEGSKMVTITAGATTATYTVATVSDSAHEPNGSVTVAVAAGTGYTVGAASSAGVTVNDDDNDPPKVANEIPNQTAGAGAAFSYVFPANTFSDADEGDTLTYTATKGDGSALPMWLTFTAGERKFSGTPASSNIGTVSVKVTATDPSSASVSDTFDISVVALPVITVTAGSAVSEGTAASFTVTSSPAPAANLTVNLTVSEPDGSDFVAATNEGPKTVTITGGATTATFTVATVNDTTDEPHGSVTVAVATGTGYVAGTASSASVSVTDNENVAPTGSVTISGTVTQKQELTAVTTTLADSDGLGTLLYQWKRAGSDISGATSSKYTLVQDDVGRAISVTVSWTDGGGFAESLDSSATAAVANVNDDPTGAVTISGTATEGQTLTAVTTTIGDIDGLGVFSYQWKRAGTDITGETSSSYVLVQDDVGKVITVTVSYTDGQGTSESLSASTAAVANVNDDPTGAVTITGTPTQGQTLTAVTTTIRDVDGLGTFSYQWKRAGTDISGATSSTYTLVQDDVDSKISVTVSYTDGEGTAESLDSDDTDAVANVNDAPMGSVTITGTATQNQTLTAVTSTIVDPDGPSTLSFTYQWKHAGDDADTDISGATSSTYVLGQDDVGEAIKVTVSWTDDGGQAESLTSVATAAVANVNDAPKVANEIPDQTAGAGGAFSYVFPANTFSDDDGDTLTYTATTSDDMALPMWLSFTASERKFSGTPASSNIGTLSVKVTATDPSSASVSDEFDISVVALPVITITAGSAVTEGTAATFTVTASSAPSANLTVNLTVSEPEGSDFVAATNEGSKTVTITASSTTATFTVATVTDTTFESDGSVSVAIAAGTGYVVGTTASASVTVSDDDPLISNLGRTRNFSVNLATFDIAQEFTTGPISTGFSGYTLDGVGVDFASAPSGVSVYIATGLPSATNVVATLTNPDSLGSGTLTFTAPADTTLSASTTYWVVVEGSSGQVSGTNSSAEDAGGANGWSIGNNRRTRTTGSWSSSSRPVKISVHGSLTVDEDPATVVSATVLGTKLTITFNEDLVAAPNLVNGSFGVKKTPQSGTEGPVGLSTTTGPVVSGRTVVLTLASAVAATDDDVKVSYTKPGTVTDNAIKDVAGNATDSFTDQAVDIVPTITITGGAAVTEGTAATFTVTASPAPSADLVVSLTVSDVAGSDFVAAADEGPKTVTITGGSTSATFTVDTETDSTHELKGSVTVAVAAGAGYVVGTASSAGVAVNDDDNGGRTGAVTINGTATQGQTLTAVTSTIRDPDGPATLSFSYQWKRAGTDISGATSSSYVLVQDDVDSAISVTVSWTDGESHAESLDSDATDAVANVNDAPTGAVTISGTATQGQTLTAVTSTIVDPDGPSTLSFTYQWKRGDDDISGATSSTYVLKQDDVDSTIKVTVSWTDDGGTAESLDSDATDAVANVNDAPKVANEIPNQTAGASAAFSYVFPADTFSDDDGDTLTYSATKGDDMALPMWLSFTASERKFSGTPASSNIGTLSVKVTATDPSSASVSDEFDISVVALPVITITAGSAVTEGTAATFTVTASTSPADDLTVNLTVSEPEGSDFVAATNEGTKTVTITSSSTTATFTVATVTDTTFESDGSVSVTVTTGTGYVVGTTASASVTVSDDDPLISNLGRTRNFSVNLATFDIAQEFTTGPISTGFSGYTLDGVGVDFASAPSGVSVYIATGLPSATNVVATLTNPDSLGSGTLTFTAPADTTLSASTTYWVVVEGSSGQVSGTNSSAEDAGGANGWSIGNNRRTRTTGSWSSSSRPVKISVHGSLTVDEDPATVVSATVLGTKLTITFNEDLVAAPNLVNGSFGVKKTPQSGTELPVGLSTTTGPVVSGRTVVLTLASAVAATDDDVKVSYTKPGTVTDNAIKDVAGNATDSFTDQAVDIVPTITITGGAAVTEGTAATFTVTASPAPSADLTVNLTVTDVAGSDFVAAADEGSKTVTVTAGSTTATFTVTTQGDSTHELKGPVTVAVAAGTGYVVGTASSAGVEVKDDDNGGRTGAVTISGTPTQGQTLNAVTSTIRDPDGPSTLSFSYQWKRAGTDISGATSSTYVLVQADVDSAISVTVSWTDGEGHAESLDSDATDAVANVNDAPTGAVTISGTATQGQTLTAVTSTIVDPDGPATLSFSYQWKRGNDNITEATSSTYVLKQADVGKVVSVTVSWTDAFSQAESLDSDATDAVADANVAPTVANPIADQTAGVSGAFSFAFAADTFADDDGDTLTYTATQNDASGSALPMWLTFTASTRTFSGTPSSSTTDDVSVKVTATDPGGLSVSDTFDIDVVDLPVITISGGTAVTEGTAATFTVTAAPAPSADLTVNLTVSEPAGSDFVAAANEGSKTATITSSQTTATFTVATVGDTAFESDGSVSVAVAAGTGYVVGTTASASVAVNDDDPLVSNIGQSSTSSSSLNLADVAQEFTTGAHPAGYILDSVGVNFSSAPSNVSVKIATGLPSATNPVATLANPTSLGAGTLTFTAPADTILSANTTYWVVVEGSSGQVRIANSGNEDAGGAAGWSIGNNRRTRNRTSTGAWTGNSFGPLRIGVHGSLVVDEEAPTVASASVIGTKLTIAFNENLAAAPNLANTSFAVKKTPQSGTEGPVGLSTTTGPVVSGKTVVLTLASAVVATDTDVKVSYTKPGTVTDNAIKDPSGNAADTFTDQAVTIVPTITISGGAAVTEGTAATFTVTASPAPSADLVVSLTVSDVAGSDFVAAGDEGPKTVTITGGSTSATFTVDTETDSTHELKGSVTVAVAAGAGYVVGTASSAGVEVNDDDNGDPTGAVTISGTPTQGQTLTAVTSTIRDPDGPSTLSFTYQWKRAGSDISGATSSSYRAGAGRRGQRHLGDGVMDRRRKPRRVAGLRCHRCGGQRQRRADGGGDDQRHRHPEPDPHRGHQHHRRSRRSVDAVVHLPVEARRRRHLGRDLVDLRAEAGRRGRAPSR